MNFIAESEMRELKAIRAKRIGLDDLRAGLDVRLMNAKDSFGFSGIDFIETALRTDHFMQHRAHAAIGD